MKLDTYTQEGEKKGSVTLSDAVFGLPMNQDLLAQAVRVYEARRRRPLAHAKRRSEVRGGGRKPWRQKGTGRARHGSIRSPLWRGGGVTFGPLKDRNFSLNMPKHMRSRALAVALSAKVADEELFVLDGLSVKEGKTKEMAAVVNALRNDVLDQEAKDTASIMLVTGDRDEALLRAVRNIPNVTQMNASQLSAYDVLLPRFLVMTKDAVEAIEQRLGAKNKKETPKSEEKPKKPAAKAESRSTRKTTKKETAKANA